MSEFSDVVDFFIRVVNNLKDDSLNPSSPLEEIVLKSAGRDLAYIDNRRDALGKFRFDFWESLMSDLGEMGLSQLLRNTKISNKLQYSKSEQFPDFLFKVRRTNGNLTCGSLLELKDSAGRNIASFNSTLPTHFKNLDEIDIVNGKNLVSRISSIIDENYSQGDCHALERRCFYLVRTHRGTPEKIRISIIDGSFFETVPKDHLIHQVFLQILSNHINSGQLEISPEKLSQVQEVLSNITDQTIIATSRIVNGASIRPRLRIMAEVHREGNPHSSHYPQISEGTFNFILLANAQSTMLIERLVSEIPELEIFTIKHLRNGEHIVFQFRFNPQTTLRFSRS